MQTQATDAAGQPAQQPTPEAITALVNRAKTGFLFAAHQGNEANMRFWQGHISFVQALQSGIGQKAADKDQRTSGYLPPTYLEAAWAALPVNAKSLSMTEVQEFLRLHLVEQPADPIATPNFDGVEKVENSVVPIVSPNNEHPTLVVDGVDSALHAPSVVDAATVAQAEVPA